MGRRSRVSKRAAGLRAGVALEQACARRGERAGPGERRCWLGRLRLVGEEGETGPRGGRWVWAVGFSIFLSLFYIYFKQSLNSNQDLNSNHTQNKKICTSMNAHQI